VSSQGVQPGGIRATRAVLAGCRNEMAKPKCAFCKAPLPKRRARCRACGWAVEYDPETSRRERDLVLGVSLTVVGIVLGIAAFAIALLYVKPLL